MPQRRNSLQAGIMPLLRHNSIVGRPMEVIMDVRFVDEIGKIDFAKVTAMLTDAYWCVGITQSEVLFSAQNSTLVVGAYLNDELVGYLRVISDRTRFAYILDVIIDSRYRKQGIGQRMVQYTLGRERLKLVYQWLLRTKDAQGVYSQVGFRTMEHPEQWMMIQKDRPNRDAFSQIADMPTVG
jgi:GNAT superfamily N-acetyltransferase